VQTKPREHRAIKVFPNGVSAHAQVNSNDRNSN
jgi:hypothetical protein